MERLKITPSARLVVGSAVPGPSNPVVAYDTAAEGHGLAGRLSATLCSGAAGVPACNPFQPSMSGELRGRAPLRPSWTRHPRQAPSERPARRYINQVFHDLAGQVATMENSHDAPDPRGSRGCRSYRPSHPVVRADAAAAPPVPLKPCPVEASSGQALSSASSRNSVLSPRPTDLPDFVSGKTAIRCICQCFGVTGLTGVLGARQRLSVDPFVDSANANPAFPGSLGGPARGIDHSLEVAHGWFA